ncbi:MAG: hypothetical protein C0605_08370 [Hyphomicrobiales bacterium]|nr:MAG: hypothetical protein C0605_08370 [Hyphomicrobiales bacterium]
MKYSPNEKSYISQIDVDLVKEALASNDDVGVVLRAQFEIERALVRVLDEKYPNYPALGHRYLHQHLNALRAIGIEGSVIRIARKVSQVRNDMAHVGKGVRTKIEKEDLGELYSNAAEIFGMEDFGEFKVQIGQDNEPKLLKEMPLAAQFLLIAAAAAMALDAYLQIEP